MNSIWLRQPVNEWLPTTWYPRLLPILPDLCVGRFPAQFGRTGTDRWKVWFVENEEEATALKASLAKPIPMRDGAVDFERGPDAAVSKVDRKKHYGDIAMALYPPAPEFEKEWPHITVFRMPSVTVAGHLARELARGVYSFEVDMSFAAAMERVSRAQRLVVAAGVNTTTVFTGTPKT